MAEYAAALAKITWVALLLLVCAAPRVWLTAAQTRCRLSAEDERHIERLMSSFAFMFETRGGDQVRARGRGRCVGRRAALGRDGKGAMRVDAVRRQCGTCSGRLTQTSARAPVQPAGVWGALSLLTRAPPPPRAQGPHA